MSFDETASTRVSPLEQQAERRAPDVLGDFLVGIGPRAAAYVARHAPLAGGSERPEQSDGFACRTSGATRVRRSAHRIALGLDDLVAGCADAALDALGGAPPWADWRGRFAQLVFDGRTRQLFVASDHFGTLPIYWLEHENELLVASDLRLLLAAPWCDRSADPLAVFHYLNFAIVPAPMTIVAQVRRLGPATELAWQDGRARLRRYWRPAYGE
jgi:asparagine synthase (glutamine-hydrolysing)